MRTIDNWLDRFAFRHPKFGIPNLMMYFIIGTVAVFLLDLSSGQSFSQIISFSPYLILHGEIWRLVTFIFVPSTNKIIWFVFSIFFYSFLGPFMEREWGTAKFNLFYLIGIFLTALFGMATAWIFNVWYLSTATAYYLHLSLFLAFATLYPDMQMRFFFLIDIKAKWLALFYLFFIVGDLMQTRTVLLPLVLPMVLPPILASWTNYLIFFWSDVKYIVGLASGRAKHQYSSQTVNFKKATSKAYKEKGYIHKCAVCGKTDTEYPDLEFRYCSKCNGYYCYCSEHINNHTHIE